VSVVKSSRAAGRALYLALSIVGVALLIWGYHVFRVELPNYKTDGVGYWTWQEMVGFGGGAALLVAAAVRCVLVERRTVK
jgi:hypothetical protein